MTADMTDSPNTALSAAIANLRLGDFQSRWDISRQIASFGITAIAPLVELIETADADDWELAWFTARILGELEHPSAITALSELICLTNSEEVAGMAAAALANLGVKAIAPLSQLLNQETTRSLAIQALCRIRHPDIIPPLLIASRNASPSLRATAIEALTDFQHPQISAILFEALQDPAESVRRSAIVALGLQADLHDKFELTQRLRPFLGDVSLEVGRQAAISLGRIGTHEAAEALAALLHSDSQMSDALKSGVLKSDALKIEAIRALTWIGTAEALTPLQTFLEQPPDRLLVYQEALAVLGRVEPAARSQAAQILIQLLQSRYLQSEYATPEHSASEAQSNRSKQAIALSLGQLRQPQALEPLIQLLADENTGVRLHAIAALKQLDPQAAHERLQALSASPELNERLKQGVAIALQEWS